MPAYRCTGTVTKTGIEFFVTARARPEALAKIKAMKWDFTDDTEAECVNAMPDATTLRINEQA